MSRITYSSEAEVRDVAAKLRENKVPADVIHLDVGWFQTDWRSDFQFSKDRFKDPKKRSLAVVNLLHNSTSMDKKLFYAPSMQTVFKHLKCISPSRFL
jgi:alpha-glucosidase (family GH31 glycosyl hydrolase)